MNSIKDKSGFAVLMMLILLIPFTLSGWLLVKEVRLNKTKPLITHLLKLKQQLEKERHLDLITIHLSKFILKQLHRLHHINNWHHKIYRTYQLATLSPPIKAELLKILYALKIGEIAFEKTHLIILYKKSMKLCRNNGIQTCVPIVKHIGYSFPTPIVQLAKFHRENPRGIAPGFLRITPKYRLNGYFFAVLPPNAIPLAMKGYTDSLLTRRVNFFEHRLSCIHVTFQKTHDGGLLNAPSLKAKTEICNPNSWLSPQGST